MPIIFKAWEKTLLIWLLTCQKEVKIMKTCRLRQNNVVTGLLYRNKITTELNLLIFYSRGMRLVRGVSWLIQECALGH